MLHPIRNGEITFSDALDIAPIPCEPFYGAIGATPELEAISSLAPGFHGGNMNAADGCPGNTVHLTVNVPGALLHIGEVHAAQGDAEVCGVATEIPTRSVLTVDLIKNNAIATPRVESDEFLMTIGSARPMEKRCAHRLCPSIAASMRLVRLEFAHMIKRQCRRSDAEIGHIRGWAKVKPGQQHYSNVAAHPVTLRPPSLAKRP